MKRILIIGFTDNPGGIENVIMNYYRCINKDKFQFDFLYSAPTIAYDDEIHSLGGKTYHIEAKHSNYFKYKKDVNKFFKENHKMYSAIWVNFCNITNLDYLKLAKKYNIKTRILHAHNSQNMASKIKLLIHKWNRIFIRKYVTDYWSCSLEASRYFFTDKIIKSNKHLIINNAIDCERFLYNIETRKKIRKELKLDNKTVFGNVGRLHFQKNQEFALRVFCEYLKFDKNAIFLLVGDGEDREKLQQLCVQYEISDKVIFLGARNDIPELLQAMDIFLFPSAFEGFGLSLVEAQASKLLVFTSTNVPKETNLSDSIYYMDLKDEKKWAQRINKEYKKFNRDKVKVYIKEKGFDIKNNIQQIETRL